MTECAEAPSFWASVIPPLAGATAGAIIGGLIAFYISWRASRWQRDADTEARERQRADERREKLKSDAQRATLALAVTLDRLFLRVRMTRPGVAPDLESLNSDPFAISVIGAYKPASPLARRLNEAAAAIGTYAVLVETGGSNPEPPWFTNRLKYQTTLLDRWRHLQPMIIGFGIEGNDSILVTLDDLEPLPETNGFWD